MKMNKLLKKAVAIGASGAMMGATIMGALALDLSDYPKPFVTDGVFDGKIVVGLTAQPADIVSAIDVAASLQAAAVEQVEAEVTSDEVSVTGGESEEVYFGSCLTGTSYDDGDLAGFIDSEISFNGEKVDVEEKIYIETNEVCIDDAQYDADFADTPYLIVLENSDSLYYRYLFEDDKILANDVGEDDDNDTLEIKLLGKNIEIISIENEAMTVVASTERYMQEGDSIEVDGHTVKLDRVGDSSVRVSVDGQAKTISNGNEVEFEDADDYKVELKEDTIFYIEGADDNSATLKFGTDITDTVDEGDPLELFGESDDINEAEWYWKEIAVTGNYVDYIDIGYNQKRVNPDDPDGYVPLAEGEKLMFPNDYASVEFANVKKDDRHEMQIYFEDNFELNKTEDSEDVIVFKLPSGEEYFVMPDGTTKTEIVYVQIDDTKVHDWYLWYKDENDKLRYADENETFQLVLDADEINITPTGNDQTNFTILAPENSVINTIEFEVEVTADGYQNFGGTEGGDDAELWVDAVDISTKDDPYLTDYGIIIKGSGDSDGPEQGLDDDELYLLVPEERPQAEVVIAGPGTTTSSTAGVTSYKVNPVAVGMAVLDKDAPTLGSEPLLVVGGPIVNTVAADLLGNPTAEQISELFSPGKAMIKLYTDKNAILVAGYDAEDTMGAAYVLADYEDYDLSGNEVEVVVPSLNSITVNPVE